MGGAWKFICKRAYIINFLGDSLQNRNKIKPAIQIDKIIHSYLPRTVKKRKLDPGVLRHISIALYSSFFYFVTLFVVLWLIVILTIYLCHIFFKKIICTLVLGGEGSRLKAYVHIQGGEEGGLRLRNLSVRTLWISTLFIDLIQVKCVYARQSQQNISTIERYWQELIWKSNLFLNHS